MMIDPHSHLLLHRLQQRERDLHLGHVLALRERCHTARISQTRTLDIGRHCGAI